MKAYDEVKRSNFEDLQKFFYVETGAFRAAKILYGVTESWLPEGLARSFFLPEVVKEKSVIPFGPLADLLKFYSLLEIALVATFIPEPDYASAFWSEIRKNLSLALIRPYILESYPVQLPRFLLGRLEGRMHLAEEFSEDRYGEVCAALLSFLSQVSRWRDADIQVFLRFVLSSETDQVQFDLFQDLIGNRDEFMSRILARRITRQSFDDHLLHGLSKVLNLCEDLDRLLSEMDRFPLLQSAMSNYYADLFWAMNQRLPRYLKELVQSFSNWTTGTASDKGNAERAQAVSEYIAEVEQFLARLSSGTAGNILSSKILQPAGVV